MKYTFQSALSIIFILLLNFCNTQNARSQTKEELLKVYNNETIHTFGKYFIKGTKRLSFGELKPDFTSGITSDLYKKAKSDRILGGVFTVTAIGALVTGIIVKKNNTGLGALLSGFAIGLNLGSIHFRNRSSELLDRAIWHRNKEILFDVKE
jgi:hypothetical protein